MLQDNIFGNIYWLKTSKKIVFSGKKKKSRHFFLQIPKDLTFCEDLILRISSKFAKFAKINQLKVICLAFFQVRFAEFCTSFHLTNETKSPVCFNIDFPVRSN